MGYAVTFCRSSQGIEAPIVSVETNITQSSMPSFSLVGLPEAAVRESKERVRVALRNAQFRFPHGRITINLAPAELKKSGGRYDLAIAIGILAASNQVSKEALSHYEFAGELSLTGTLRPIHAALPFAIATHQAERALIISEGNQNDVMLVDDLTVYAANHLLQVCALLDGKPVLEPAHAPPIDVNTTPDINMSEVRGQQLARKAMELAAAGGHHCLLVGPPGAGKTMLSHALQGILPTLSKADALQVAAIQSLCHQRLNPKRWLTPPFRAPHHSASHVALVGGGSPPGPGEISRAHRGILFLDELPEFPRAALEALREPIESGQIHIARANWQTTFPAQFQLIAAMNPCPCGYANSKQKPCRCTPDQILRYQNKISGPLLDRIDLHVQLSPLPTGELTRSANNEEDSQTIKQRVILARQKQLTRQRQLNRHIRGKQLQQVCQLGTAEKALVENAIERLHLSTRSYQNILRVARTIADLANDERVSTIHLSEALCFRNFDKGHTSWT